MASFNPRTHIGCDFKGLCYLIEFESFNPRTHIGCDALGKDAKELREVSIHAPT